MILIREYCQSDSDSLVLAINSVCREEKWMHTSRFVPTKQWLQILHDHESSHLLLVAAENKTIIGWCRVFVQGHTGDLGIGVMKSYRDQGIGSQLLRIAVRWAKNHVLATTLCCRRDNSRALHVFEKYGFVRYGFNDQMITMMIVSGETAYA